MSTPLALDTSVAVPLLVRRHRDHARIAGRLGGRPVVLSGHALAETYSVITRFPDDLRIDPIDVPRLFEASFGPTAVISTSTARRLPEILAAAAVSGGAVYDALVGLAARENKLALATRDARAHRTYDALGVKVELVA